MPSHVEKAHGYVTHEGRLLVFEHPEHPEAGIQIPGGTIESGEVPREAVVREAREETGLEELQFAAKLGVHEFDMAEWRNEIQRRHVFWLVCLERPPESWRGWERAHEPPIPFDFYWVDLDDAPALHAGQGRLLDRLKERVRSQAQLKH